MNPSERTRLPRSARRRAASYRREAGALPCVGERGDAKIAVVEAELVSRATAAATALARGLGLRVNDVAVMHNSNKLALRLIPCDVFLRVAETGHDVAALEVELAQRLAATASPVAALEPRVEPHVYERDGFAVTFWTYYDAVAPDPESPTAYADALHRLHTGLASVDIATPHFLDRVAEAERLLAHRHMAVPTRPERGGRTLPLRGGRTLPLRGG